MRKSKKYIENINPDYLGIININGDTTTKQKHPNIKNINFIIMAGE